MSIKTVRIDFDDQGHAHLEVNGQHIPCKGLNVNWRKGGELRVETELTGEPIAPTVPAITGKAEAGMLFVFDDGLGVTYTDSDGIAVPAEQLTLYRKKLGKALAEATANLAPIQSEQPQPAAPPDPSAPEYTEAYLTYLLPDGTRIRFAEPEHFRQEHPQPDTPAPPAPTEKRGYEFL